jgi:hypothetical protein
MTCQIADTTGETPKRAKKGWIVRTPRQGTRVNERAPPRINRSAVAPIRGGAALVRLMDRICDGH